MATASLLGSRFRTEFLARIVSAISGALLIVILARLLDPDGYGLLYLTLAFVGIAKLFAKLGVGRSAARYIAEYKENDPSQIPHILRVSFTITLFLIVIVSTVTVLGNQHIANLLDEPELASFLVLGAMYLAFTTLTGYVRQMLQGFEAIEPAAVIKIINGVGKLVFAAGFVVIGLGATGALAGYIFSSLLGTAVGLAIIYVRFYRDSEIAPTMEPGLTQRIAEYAVPLTATNAARVLDKDIDTVLVGFFLNPVAVSYYVISKQVVTFIETPISALGFTLAPTFAAEKSAGNIGRATRIYEEAFVHSMLLYIPAAVGIILVAEPLIELAFGTDYIGAVPVLQVLGFYAILLSINLIAAKALDFLGRARERAIVKGVTSVMNVGLNIVLIPMIGVVGAAIATIITYSLYAFANVYIIHQELELRVWHLLKNIALITAITATMGVVVFLLLGYIEGWISLLLVVGVGVAVWALLSTVIGLLDVREVVSQIT